MDCIFRPYASGTRSSSNQLRRSSRAFSVRTGPITVRLQHTGLRNISITYSHISLDDVANKLRLETVANAESIVAKAIRDGVINATLDHTNGCMVSKETGDTYSTTEPQMAFNFRIAFCLNMNNEASVPTKLTQGKKESAEERREKQEEEQELAKHIGEDDNNEF